MGDTKESFINNNNFCMSFNILYDFYDFRYTINQAKEMFRFTPSQENDGRDKNMNDNVSRKSYMLKKEDSTSRPLLNRMHSAQEKWENKNLECKTKDEKSISTSSSIL